MQGGAGGQPGPRGRREGAGAASSVGGRALYVMMRRKWRLYTRELPASISDPYYCLSEYCKGRGLADDPIGRPLGEALDERERAALA